MSLLTRIKVFGSLAVAAVVAAFAYQVFDPGPGADEMTRKRDKAIYLRVDFDDAASRPVIVYQVGPQKPQTATPTRSAWNATVMATEGDLVILNVSQKAGGGTRCVIVAKDTIESSKSMYGPGSISCQYKVV